MKRKKTICFCVAAHFIFKQIFLRSRRDRGVIFKAAQRVTSLLFIVVHLWEGRVWSIQEIIASCIT